MYNIAFRYNTKYTLVATRVRGAIWIISNISHIANYIDLNIMVRRITDAPNQNMN